jgi:Tfp pilus assembly protein PilF
VKTEVFIKTKDREDSNRTEKHSRQVFFLVIIITALVFSGSLKLGWTNWDDDLYIYENPLVSKGTLKEIFTTLPASNTYNPLVIASFALEWKLVKNSPFLYHLDNVLLHLLCTVLALLFFRSIGLSIWWSGFAALLFGIHPMRVESVAWITERKDILYAIFCLATLLAYIRYIVSGKSGQLLLTFIFFVFALLSKGVAMILPLVLILLDWYFQRKIELKVIIEKVAFFGVSLIVFLSSILFFVKKANVIPNKNPVNLFDQVILSGYAYVVYILKSIVPYVTCTIYPIPASLQAEHWTGAAMAIVIIVGALAVWRKHRFITFGLLFFTINVFFLLFLPFWASDSAFLNDRYTYIAYIGLFFVMAMGMQQLSEKVPPSRLPIKVLAVAGLVILSILTVKYIPVWKNSETLWTYVIEKYPRKVAIAYLNRGSYWHKNNQPDKALEDCSTAIEINPEYLAAYRNRSVIYLERNDTERAFRDYNSYIELLQKYNTGADVVNLLLSEALSNRGTIYSQIGLYEKALIDLDMAIKLDPLGFNNYLKRAFVYMQLREYDKAIRDFSLCHHSDPADPEIINNRGVCYFRSGDFKSALDDFNKAILLDGSNPSYYRNRSYTYRNLGRAADARQDVLIAEKMGATTDPASRKLPQLH